jgi:hypothetical protein
MKVGVDHRLHTQDPLISSGTVLKPLSHIAAQFEKVTKSTHYRHLKIDETGIFTGIYTHFET